MVPKYSRTIHGWLKKMGFKVVAHLKEEQHPDKEMLYHSLGNFGVFEHQIKRRKKRLGRKPIVQRKFVSFTPWGIDFEVNSLSQLIDAYESTERISPDKVLN